MQIDELDTLEYTKIYKLDKNIVLEYAKGIVDAIKQKGDTSTTIQDLHNCLDQCCNYEYMTKKREKTIDYNRKIIAKHYVKDYYNHNKQVMEITYAAYEKLCNLDFSRREKIESNKQHNNEPNKEQPNNIKK